MKIRLYNDLFRILSYLSDKTNGAPFSVKYKLLLGSFIVGLTGVTGESCRGVKTCYAAILKSIEDSTQILCYDQVAPPRVDNISHVVILLCLHKK